MRIEQATKYRCDGCQTEQTNPAGWVGVHHLMAGSFNLVAGGSMHGEEYCATCIRKMRELVRGATIATPADRRS